MRICVQVCVCIYAQVRSNPDYMDMCLSVCPGVTCNQEVYMQLGEKIGFAMTLKNYWAPIKFVETEVTYIYTYIHTQALSLWRLWYVYVGVTRHVHAYRCMHACMHIHACMYACIYMRACMLCFEVSPCLFVEIEHVCICICNRCIYTYVYTYIHMYTYAYFGSIHAYMHMYHTPLCLKPTHAHIHTYIYTYIQLYSMQKF